MGLFVLAACLVTTFLCLTAQPKLPVPSNSEDGFANDTHVTLGLPFTTDSLYRVGQFGDTIDWNTDIIAIPVEPDYKRVILTPPIYR